MMRHPPSVLFCLGVRMVSKLAKLSATLKIRGSVGKGYKILVKRLIR
jgi:hypothetical protein